MNAYQIVGALLGYVLAMLLTDWRRSREHRKRMAQIERQYRTAGHWAELTAFYTNTGPTILTSIPRKEVTCLTTKD